MWHAGTAKRGSSEIGSCAYNFIVSMVEKGAKEFVFISDNCGGQNKNKNLVSLYLHWASKFKIVITHLYLETGHKQNQNDSVHAVIERFAKNQTVYMPSHWFQIAKSACLKSPYKVKEMGISDFYDLDKLCRETSYNFNVDINGAKVNFTEI